MTKAYKSLGCEAGYCTRQHYAAGLCRSHYQSSRLAHPAGRCPSNQAKTEALLIENLQLSMENDKLVERINVMRGALSKIGFILHDVAELEANSPLVEPGGSDTF
jgi:hypothetical protein